MTLVKLAVLDDAEIRLPKGRVTPTATHLFALTLLLSLDPSKLWSRQDLQDFLFGGAERRLAAHSLRQLLYRLRQLGLEFEERANGLRLTNISIHGPLEHLREMTADARSNIPPDGLRVLAAYAPTLSEPYLEWLDDIRGLLNARIRHLLNDDLRRFRDAHDWDATLKICNALAVLDPLNDEIVSIRAEALALVGRKTEALDTLDRHARTLDDDADSVTTNARLRARIVKLAPLKRLSTMRGRDKCLSFLEKEWSSTDGSGARLSAIIGQAGMGKTRVADEFASRIAISRGHVLRFSCDSQMRSHPLALFYHLLPQLRSMRGSLGANPEYRSALARIRPVAGTSEQLIGGDDSAEALRAEIQLALIDIFDAVTSEHPCLLIVDDAHHLDDASASVLRALATGANTAMLHILACLRPTHVESPLLLSSHRGAIHHLDPLNDGESLRLVLELRRDSVMDDDRLTWCIREAAGNPFYLQTLALHDGVEETLPNSLLSFARGLYSALSIDSRTVLEVCLLLGSHASLARVQHAAEVRDGAMLVALRELEDSGLVQFREGLLIGPHLLLVDSMVSFIPTAVAAMLRKRVADLLVGEYGESDLPPGIAWAAAQHLIGAGEPVAATHLIQRCARNAATLGEASAATELLAQALNVQLPSPLRTVLLDDQILYARAGGEWHLVASALRDRLLLAGDTDEDAERIAELRFQIIEADVVQGVNGADAATALSALLSDETAAPSIRIRSAVRLLVFADMALDPVSAREVFDYVSTFSGSLAADDVHLLRAGVVFHTAFGDADKAAMLAQHLIQLFPNPSAAEIVRQARHFAAFSFYRLRQSHLAAPICEANYEFTIARGILSDALYAASLRTDIAIADGDFIAARTWFSKCETAARGVSPNIHAPNAGYYANAGMLAMREGRFDDAEQSFLKPLREYSLQRVPRHRSVSLALSIRLKQLRGDTIFNETDEQELNALYEKGRSLGEQDTVVEALWCARNLRGDTTGASALLTEYLSVHRRERGFPEFSLFSSTSSDGAWHIYDGPLPRLPD